MSGTARKNNAFEATFLNEALSHPFAEGAFRYVAKGKYTVGERAGEACVCKWFKTGSVYEASYFATDLKTSTKAIEIISKWNELGQIDRMVQVNLPEVWKFKDDCRSDFCGTRVLQEPFIQNYQKFNSNSGWSDDGFAWGRAMQALSHYSYDASGGNLLLCDLQGGVYSDGVTITDPVIMSQHGGQYGPTDLGRFGISSFFAGHCCNEYCSRTWRKPRDQTRYHTARQGTTMEHVPTRSSRPAMTYQYG